MKPIYGKLVLATWGVIVLALTLRQAKRGEIKGKSGTSLYKARQPALFWFMTVLGVGLAIAWIIFVIVAIP